MWNRPSRWHSRTFPPAMWMGEPVRLARRDAVAAELSSLSDDEVRSLLDTGTQHRAGIGGVTQSIVVAGSPVFVKAIKLSSLEVDAGPGDTRNLFGLPAWYHYGVGEGSTGFNAWREVATHEMVSDWAIGDERSPFPLLYHWRIVPDVARREFGEAELVRAVRFWANSAEVETRAHGLVHFDAHLDNVLTTGHQVVVSDFGLAAAADFELDDAEIRFLTAHVDHDVAYCAAELANAILRNVVDFPTVRARNDWLRSCVQTGTAKGVPAPFAETIRLLAPTAALVNDFYWKLHDGHVQTRFPAEALAITLNAVGQL